jgi:hypothetical protein
MITFSMYPAITINKILGIFNLFMEAVNEYKILYSMNNTSNHS